MNICNKCNSTNLVKQGIRKGVQKYQCKDCKKYLQIEYKKPRLDHEYLSKQIIKLNKECVGIKSMARILEVSHPTIILIMKKLNIEIQENKKKEKLKDSKIKNGK